MLLPPVRLKQKITIATAAVQSVGDAGLYANLCDQEVIVVNVNNKTIALGLRHSNREKNFRRPSKLVCTLKCDQNIKKQSRLSLGTDDCCNYCMHWRIFLGFPNAIRAPSFSLSMISSFRMQS